MLIQMFANEKGTKGDTARNAGLPEKWQMMAPYCRNRPHKARRELALLPEGQRIWHGTMQSVSSANGTFF